MIPRIDISSLFGAPSQARESTDAAIREAAADIGFMTVQGVPGDALSPALRRQMLELFALPESEKRKLYRWAFDKSRPNVYRGWFPLQTGHPTYKEGIDLGPDVVHRDRVRAGDPLTEATPIPSEAALPGWHRTVEIYYRAMEATGAALMRGIARGLGIAEGSFDRGFATGISTLRLTRYPVRTMETFGDLPRERAFTEDGRTMLGAPHVDSGFLTLLAQDGVEGLQALARDGRWITVPPEEGTLAVNFGKVLERWTGGRIRATEHRVVGSGRERFSVPFFYEPDPDFEIAPLAGLDAPPFEPFLYGDHLWAATTRFVEQKGIAHLREPHRKAAS
jgi:isopenicillin N synthase-like dioxygenase